MMKALIKTLTLLLIGFSPIASAQRSSLKLIVEVPLHIGIGYEGQVSKHFSIGTSVGVLTSPNSNLIIAYLRIIGTEEDLVLLVEDAFQLGIVGEINVNYNFKRNYVGLFAQAIGVQAGDCSTEDLEDYFGVSMDDYPIKNGAALADKKIIVRTRLYQMGLLYGRRFPLKGDRFEIDAELGLSANIGSTSSISSESRDFPELSKEFNRALDEFYNEYAFVPSLGIMLVYKLRKSEN